MSKPTSVDRFKRTEHPLYKTWVNIRQRCKNPNFPQYQDYGGRGIKVCDRWESFTDFIADMGDRPEGMTLDRIDNDGDYELSNCRWASKRTQQLNSRMRIHNKSGLKGVKQHGSKWETQVHVYGIKYSLGGYSTKEEAHYVYERFNKMAQELTLKIERDLVESQIKILNKVHRVNGTTDFDNATDELIDEEIERLTKELGDSNGG